LEELQKSHGASNLNSLNIHWRSFELRPAGTELPPGYRERILAARPRFEQMVREQYGLEIRSGPFGINSRDALRLAKFAEEKGVGDAYHKAAFSAYWLEGRSIAELDVLQEIAASVGLDPADVPDALANPVYEAAVSGDIEQAYAYGINAVPTMIFANRYMVRGAQPYEVLRQVVEKMPYGDVPFESQAE
jgi:predicted DsbA family dithiol-disulfide isomerase